MIDDWYLCTAALTGHQLVGTRRRVGLQGINRARRFNNRGRVRFVVGSGEISAGALDLGRVRLNVGNRESVVGAAGVENQNGHSVLEPASQVSRWTSGSAVHSDISRRCARPHGGQRRLRKGRWYRN